MVDAPQSENLDMDTIMVDAPPLPLSEDSTVLSDSTVLPKASEEILPPLPEDPTALPKEIEEILPPLPEDPTALPKEIEELLPPLPEDPTALPKEIEEILAGVNQSPPDPRDPTNAAQGAPARETEYQRLQRRRIELAEELAHAKSSWPRVKKGPNQQDLKKILLTDGASTLESRSSAKT
jgi:hypothetical protein